MRIYLAGLYTSRGGGNRSTSENVMIAREVAESYPFDLESYHYLKNVSAAPAYYRTKKKTIFLDSGAFSMFTQGIKVSLSDYAAYVKKGKDYIHIASNIDEIGSGHEEQSWKNQKQLERFGAKIQPVHHARDSDEWLQKYLAEGYDYIFLGGMVPESTPYLREWLDHIWGRYLTNKDGTAKTKVHGFGMTTFELMRRYPWYSVDSTTWVLPARVGEILLDLPGRDLRITFGEQSSRIKAWDGHYDTLDSATKRVVDARVIELGYDPKLLRGYYGWRDHFNIGFFRRFMDRPDPTFKAKHKPVSLFT